MTGGKPRMLSLRYYLAFGTLVLFLVAFGVIRWHLSHAGDLKTEKSDYVIPSTDSAAMDVESLLTAEAPQVSYAVKSMSQDEQSLMFTPDHVILNIECKMLTGEGAAKDVAVVTMPTEDGAEFVVLGNTGTLASGQLDFLPNHTQLGRRSDGSTVVGFGALRVDSRAWLPQDSDEPVRIYRDGHIVYETNKAWDFGVSEDGASFFLYQPSPGGHSRLVVNNIDTGTQVEHELGTKLTPSSGYWRERDHVPSFSLDGSEILFAPGRFGYRETRSYYVYPVGEGRKRRITVKDFWATLLTSSESGFFVQWPEERKTGESGYHLQITKRRLDPSTGDSEILWTTRANVEIYKDFLALSQDGKWLGLDGQSYTVVDTSTGETVFSFPSSGTPSVKFARLAPVLPDGASEDDIGRQVSMGFKGNYLVGYRMQGDTSSCYDLVDETWDRVALHECLKEMRRNGSYREFYDVYDLNNVEVEGSPAYATPAYSESSCIPANPPWRGLIDANGQLAFQATQAFQESDTH